MRFKKYIVLVMAIMIIGCIINPPPPPITIAAIENALHAGVDSRSIATKIRKNGVDFALTEENRRRLKKAKADNIVMKAIRDVIKRKADYQ